MLVSNKAFRRTVIAGDKILCSDIEILVKKLFHRLRQTNVELVQIKKDFYWNIPSDQIYLMYEQPKDLDIGQVSDDWNELQKLLQDDRVPLNQHFVWLAAIFRAMGDQELL